MKRSWRPRGGCSLASLSGGALPLALWGASAMLASGCGDGVTPRLLSLAYHGQAADSPTVLLFDLEFEDEDRDLGGGILETFIDGRSSGLGLLDLEPIFHWSDLPLEANRGTLSFVLEIAAPGDDAPPVEFDLGTRVQDEQGHTSSTLQVRLRREMPQ